MRLNIINVRLDQTRNPNFSRQRQLRGRDLAVLIILVYGPARFTDEISAFIRCKISEYIQRSLAGVESAPAASDGPIILVLFSQLVLKPTMTLHVLVGPFICNHLLVHIILLYLSYHTNPFYTLLITMSCLKDSSVCCGS